MPRSMIENVRLLTIHISAPEVKDEKRMRMLRDNLIKARRLESLTIEIYPFRANAKAREILCGWKGRHALRKGLGLLRDVKVRGKVAIHLVGNHEFGASAKSAKRFEIACQQVLKEVEEAMEETDS